MYLILISTLLFLLAGCCLAKPLTHLWDSIASSYIGDLKTQCSDVQLGTEAEFQYWLRCWLGTMAGTIVLFGFVFHLWVLLIPMLAVEFLSPRHIIKVLIRIRRTVLRDQLVTALSVVANSVHAGVSLEESVQTVGETDLKPLANEFKHISNDYAGNKPFVQALEDAKNRLKLPSFAMFAAALSTNKKRGGKITATLEQLRISLLENQRLERKLETDTAAAQMELQILAVTPLIFLAFLYMTTPDGTAMLFTTFIGQILLSVAFVFVAFAYWWGDKIVHVEF